MIRFIAGLLLSIFLLSCDMPKVHKPLPHETSATDLLEFAKKVGDEDVMDTGRAISPYALSALGDYPNLDRALAEYILFRADNRFVGLKKEKRYYAYLSGIAGNPNTPPDILWNIINYPFQLTDYTPELSSDKLYFDLYGATLARIVNNPSAATEMLDKIIQYPTHDTFWALANSGNSLCKHLVILNTRADHTKTKFFATDYYKNNYPKILNKRISSECNNSEEQSLEKAK